MPIISATLRHFATRRECVSTCRKKAQATPDPNPLGPFVRGKPPLREPATEGLLAQLFTVVVQRPPLVGRIEPCRLGAEPLAHLALGGEEGPQRVALVLSLIHI